MNALEGGSSVGRYRIVEFLGAGAMGEVYLAEDPQIDRKLAIKTVRLAGRPQDVEDRKKRLLREARAAGRLLHPNVVTLFDAGETEGLLFLAFEFVEGTDLAARLDTGERLKLREALRVVRQAAEALDYAHGQGVVHRDIKPSNILLDRAGRVKVADFGIAKMAGQSTELTLAGSVMGSPQYLSPEQIRGEELDGRSDIFSLGVVLYEILSGKRPFDGDTITTLVYQILHQEPPPVSELRAVPPRLEELLRRMLAKDRDERIATAGEVAWELADIEGELADETLSAPVGTGPFEATRPLPRRTTGAAAPAVPPPPPPAARSTRGTVPASPATTPSVPPPPPPVPPVPAAQVRGAAAMPPKRSLLWVPIAAVLLLIAALAGAWYVMSRPGGPAPPQTAQAAPDLTAPVSTPGGTVGNVAPAPSSAGATAQPTLPPPAASPPRQEPPPAETGRPAAAETPGPAAETPAVSPPPPAGSRSPGTAAAPAVPPASEPAGEPEPASPREPEPAPAPAVPPAVLQQADQVVRTGLKVAFRVVPPDAHVLVDRTVLGTAADWSGAKGARVYDFPGPGLYHVKIRKQGMKDYNVAVQAEARGGVTPIVARLQPLPAAEVDASDLRTVRVRQAIALRVLPPKAAVLVDGQPVGLARRFSGGGVLRGKGEWLELTPGKHRVSIVAPGFRRQDILVEVVETAEKDRERIEVVLTQGGDGE